MKKRVTFILIISIVVFIIYAVFSIIFSEKNDFYVKSYNNSIFTITMPKINDISVNEFDILFEQIKKNNEIKIEYKEPENYIDELTIDFNSGRYPHIVIMPMDDEVIENLVLKNKLLPVTHVVNEKLINDLNIDKSMFKHLSVNDELYGLPYDYQSSALFYNSDMFSKYNVKIPENLIELKEAVSTFKQAGIIPFSLSCIDEKSPFFDYVFSNYLLDNEEMNYDEFVNVCNFIKDMYESGAFFEECFNNDSYGAQKLFIEGKTAMIVEDISFCNKISELYDKENNSIPINVTFFPDITSFGNQGDKILMYGIGKHVILFTDRIIKDSFEKQAIDLVKSIFSKENAENYFSETYLISSIKNLNPKSYYTEQMLSYFQLVENSHGYTVVLTNDFDYLEWKRTFVSMLPEFLNGGITPEKMWEVLENAE